MLELRGRYLGTALSCLFWAAAAWGMSPAMQDLQEPQPEPSGTPGAERSKGKRIERVFVTVSDGGSGPYKAVLVGDPTLPTHTILQPHGGAFAVAGVAWLNWQLKGNEEARKMFVGEGSGLAADPKWKVERKNFAMTGMGTALAQAPGTGIAPPAQGDAKEIPLYPGVAPGSETWNWKERTVTTPTGQPMVTTDVVRPVLLHYPAENGKAVGAAMIIAPGGGFRALMMSYEGVDIARRLNAMGLDAFVLKYRLIHQHGPGAAVGPADRDAIKLAADDGRRAVRLVREQAGEFGYRPDRVGMIGFSAGGMVTAEALFGPAETRPDFAAIIYGAREIREVPSPAPPLFLAVAADDMMAVGRTVDLFTAYRKGKGLAELHVFQTGAHGFVKKGGGADHFMDRLEEWLAANKLLSKTPALPVTSPPSAAAGVGGRWHAEFDTIVGPMRYDYEFKLDGDRLTGTATGGRRAEAHKPAEIKEGKVAGHDISFVEMIDIMGMEVAVKYTGKIAGDEIRFTRKVGDFATEEVVARRAKEGKATDR